MISLFAKCVYMYIGKLSCSSSGVPIDSPHVIVFSNGTTIILRKMGPVHTIVLAKQFTHSRAPNKCRTLQDLDDDDTAFWQKLSCSSSGVPIDSPHVIVFSNGTTIILRKMGPVCTIVLAKQFRHGKALIAFERIKWTFELSALLGLCRPYMNVDSGDGK